MYMISVSAFSQINTSTGKDTTFYVSPVIVYPTQAKERETPVTFSNINAEEIKERYSVQDIPILLSELPSITTYSENGNGIGYNYINLRGFDQRRLSIMINGIPQNDPEDHNVYWIDFPDLLSTVDLIQVQRGAGSAFYGPPAIGGSVNLVTNPFMKDPGITVESILGFQEFGDSSTSLPLNTKKFSVSINSGLVSNKYMFYGKLGKITSSGYRQNSWVDMNSYFLGAVRFDDNMTTRFHFFGGPLSDGLAYFGLPKFVVKDKKLRRQNIADGWSLDSTGRAYSWAAERRKQEVENFSQPHYELINELKIIPSVTLHNSLFFYTGDGFFDYDASWADTTALRLGFKYGIPTSQNPTNTLVRAFVGNNQWGWLPNVEIKHENGLLSLGAEIRVHRSVHWGKIQFAEGLPQNIDPDYHFYEYNGKKNIYSFYVHELFRSNEDISLMADVQFVKINYGIANEKYLGNNFNLPYLFINPKFGINYNIDSEWNGYFSLAYTSREPRLKNLYAAEYSFFGEMPLFETQMVNGVLVYNFSKPLAKPEQLMDFELGLNYNQANTRMAVNVYWMEFTNELVENGQVDYFGQPITGNAKRTRHLGFEFDGAVKLINNISVNGNLTISQNRLIKHSEYIEMKDTTGNKIYIPQLLDNNPIGGFPSLLGNVRLSYKKEPLSVSIVMKYVGSFYTDNFKNTKNQNDAYAVVNTEVLYNLTRVYDLDMTIRTGINNIFNNLYFANGEGEAFFPAAERNYIVGLTITL